MKIMWTRQVPQVWEEIKTTGVYRVKKEYIQQKNDTIADFYLKLYEWYTKEAKKRIEIPEECSYPIWLSLDESSMLQPVENTVILKVEVPDDQYVICNMDHWGYRVNYWYIPLDDADRNNHILELKKYGISAEDDLVLSDKGNFYPLLRKKIMDSWERVFLVPQGTEQELVGTTWQLRKDWIKEVRLYGKAGTKNK